MYLSTLSKIQATRSRLNKMHYLKEAKDDYTLRHILLYTYHPLWHYYITRVSTVGQGSETLQRAPWIALLDQLKDRSLSGYEAQRTIADFITHLTREDGELFKRILKKNLRIGISIRTINTSELNLQIPVFGAMLANTYKGTLLHPMYMSIKHDGVRAIYKNGTLYTRNGHVILGCEHIITQAKQLGHCMLDGELMIPNVPFQESSGMIRSFNKTPKALYKVFDIPNNPSHFINRYRTMKDSFEYTIKQNPIPAINMIKHVLASTDQAIQKAYNKVLDAGYEGLMLKDPNHVYEVKRSSSWLKLKATNSVDIPIIGFFEGQGKYENTLGSIVVQTDQQIQIRVGGGFSDELRNHIWNNKDLYMGVTAEIAYHEFTPGGSLRHPRFVRFRADK